MRQDDGDSHRQKPIRAITFAAVTPRGGVDRNNPCQDHGTSATNGGPEKRENASPLFEIEQGAAFMVPQNL